MAEGRADIDDVAVALRLHHTNLVLHAEQRAEHIGVESRGIALGGLVDDEAGLALRAGGVHRGVDPTEAGDGLVDERGDLAIPTDIRLDEERVAADRLEFGFERFALRLATASNDDGVALFGEGESGSAADTGDAAGDEDDFLVHDFVPCLRVRRQGGNAHGKPFFWLPCLAVIRRFDG